MKITQYDVILAPLDPATGSEMKKTRPCLVISPDEMNQHLKTIVVAPMTRAVKSYPSRSLVVHNKVKSQVVLDQIRTIDKGRIIKVLGAISKEEIINCKAIIKETFVD